MDPPNTFLVWSHTKCSSPINHLFHGQLYHEIVYIMQGKLEQLERLRSEDTPWRPMITPYYWPVYFESQVHIIDQLISDPKSKQGESRKIRKICEKLKFYNFVIDLTLNTPSDGSDYLWQTWK